MTSRTLSLTINCPDWCQESPLKHLADGMMFHKRTVGKVAALTGKGDAAGDVVEQVEVTIERYDDVDKSGLTAGPLLVRLGGDELYPVDAARELAALLLRTAGVLDAVSPVGDTTTQVIAEQDAVAGQGGHA